MGLKMRLYIHVVASVLTFISLITIVQISISAKDTSMVALGIAILFALPGIAYWFGKRIGESAKLTLQDKGSNK